MNVYLKLDHIDKYFDKGGARAERRQEPGGGENSRKREAT